MHAHVHAHVRRGTHTHGRPHNARTRTAAPLVPILPLSACRVTSLRRYAERVGHEKLVDVEALYARLRRSVVPTHGREPVGIETESAKLERELEHHPNAPRTAVAMGPRARHDYRY